MVKAIAVLWGASICVVMCLAVHASDAWWSNIQSIDYSSQDDHASVKLLEASVYRVRQLMDDGWVREGIEINANLSANLLALIKTEDGGRRRSILDGITGAMKDLLAALDGNERVPMLGHRGSPTGSPWTPVCLYAFARATSAIDEASVEILRKCIDNGRGALLMGLALHDVPISHNLCDFIERAPCDRDPSLREAQARIMRARQFIGARPEDSIRSIMNALDSYDVDDPEFRWKLLDLFHSMRLANVDAIPLARQLHVVSAQIDDMRRKKVVYAVIVFLCNGEPGLDGFRSQVAAEIKNQPKMMTEGLMFYLERRKK